MNKTIYLQAVWRYDILGRYKDKLNQITSNKYSSFKAGT